MANSIPIVIIVIGVLLAVVALLVWRRRKEVKLWLEGISNKRKKAFFAQWIIGIVIALTAAIFMFDGDILGENTSGISTVIGIVGICLIATSNVHLLPLRRK
jgi:LPXTG-motif cell wall-anchored protein